jgi:hypothetical protein
MGHYPSSVKELIMAQAKGAKVASLIALEKTTGGVAPHL